MSGFDLLMYIKYRNAMDTRESDPDETIQRLQDMRLEAIENQSDKWRILADHWITQTYLNWKKDYTVAGKVAVQSAVEYRKPQYTNYQEYICIQNDLMLVYNGIDPVGYAPEIKEAIDLTINKTTPDINCHFCLNRDLIDYHKHTNHQTKARQQAAKFFDMTERQKHYRVQAYEQLCYFAQQDQAWLELLALSQAGIALAEEEDQTLNWIILKCYELIATYYLGDEDKALGIYNLLQYRVNNLKMVQGYEYYRLMMHYQETQGNLDHALKHMTDCIHSLENTGRPFWECKARLEQIRLLKALGQAYDEVLSAYQATKEKLKAKNQFDAELDAILTQKAD